MRYYWLNSIKLIYARTPTMWKSFFDVYNKVPKAFDDRVLRLSCLKYIKFTLLTKMVIKKNNGLQQYFPMLLRVGKPP